MTDIEYSDRMDADAQIAMEESIASYLFETFRCQEEDAAEASRELLKRVIAAFRSDLIAGDLEGHVDYDVLIEGIKKAPITWVVALMLECVEAGYISKVFLPSGASTIARQYEERKGYDNAAMLKTIREDADGGQETQQRDVSD